MGRVLRERKPAKTESVFTKCWADITWIERNDLTLEEEQKLSSGCPRAFFEWSSEETQKHVRNFACKDELSPEFFRAVESALQLPKKEFGDSVSFLKFKKKHEGIYLRIDDVSKDRKKCKDDKMIDLLRRGDNRARKFLGKTTIDPKKDLDKLTEASLSRRVLPVYVYEVNVDNLLKSGKLYNPNTKIKLWHLKDPLSFHGFQRVNSKDEVHGYSAAGLNRPQIYISGRSSFTCWHQEELGPYSILYLAKGAPKVWLFVAEKDTKKFIDFARNYVDVVDEKARDCGNVMHSKRLHIDYRILLQEGIEILGIEQKEGTYVMVPGHQFHAVENSGESLGVTVNFTPEWYFKESPSTSMQPVFPCYHPEHLNPCLNTFNRQNLREKYEKQPGMACSCDCSSIKRARLTGTASQSVQTDEPQIIERESVAQGPQAFNRVPATIQGVTEMIVDCTGNLRNFSELPTDGEQKKKTAIETKLIILRRILEDLKKPVPEYNVYNHINKRAGICLNCSRMFWDLLKHESVHKTEQFTCFKCGKHLTRRDNAVRHYDRKHNKIVKPIGVNM